MCFYWFLLECRLRSPPSQRRRCLLLNNILPLTCALPSTCSFPPRVRHHPEGAFPPQSFHRELPAGGDRVVPAQEAAAHPELADPAQPQRALRGREGPSHQDPAEEMQLPQEPGVSVCAHARTHTAVLSVGTVKNKQLPEPLLFHKAFFIWKGQARPLVRGVCPDLKACKSTLAEAAGGARRSVSPPAHAHQAVASLPRPSTRAVGAACTPAVLLHLSLTFCFKRVTRS